MMQETIVALIVAYAAWAVAKRYAPKLLRAWVRSTAATAAKRVGLVRFADKLQAASPASASSCGDGCGTCGGCSPADSTKSNPKAGRHSMSVEQLRRTIPR
jgi:hypothetical protein